MDAALATYRGLILKTASLHVHAVEEDFEDIVQLFTIKVWRAIVAYDPARDRGKGRDSYVFACLTCAVIDLRKKKRRGDLYIEDVAPARGTEDARDQFNRRYFAVEHDEAYADVDGALHLPDSLTPLEAQVAEHLAHGWKQAEVARDLGLDKATMERTMRSIRSKLSDRAPAVVDDGQLELLRAAA